MAYCAFSEFVRALDQAGELIRVTEPVATELEITELADRQMKTPRGGKALLFEKPTINGKPSQFPLAINTMGSERRMALAIGVKSVDELARQMQLILKAKPPRSMREGWTLLKQGIDLLHARPKTGFRRPVQRRGSPFRRRAITFRSMIFLFSSVGRKMVDALSRCRWFTRRIPTPVSET